MSKYPLLPHRRASRRMRWKLVLLSVVTLALASHDQFNGLLGPNWYFLWLALTSATIPLVYYALLLPRAALYVKPE